MGISLGKTNFCLQALIKVGLIKARNFRNAKNKAAYLYKLTPSGIEEKARVTRDFLQRKLAEYEEIQKEIAELQDDLAADVFVDEKCECPHSICEQRDVACKGSSPLIKNYNG